MKNNRSLAISCNISDFRAKNTIGLLESVFPRTIFENIDRSKTRNRVFNQEKTLLTMVLSSLQKDKSLKNAVVLSHMLHQQERHYAQSKAGKQVSPKLPDKLTKTTKVKISKSLESDISLNTAAYSKARKRLPLKLANDLFKQSRIEDASNVYSHWYGYRVFIADGTYVQMQDTEEIKKEFPLTGFGGSSRRNEENYYPNALLEVIIERGTGQIHSFKLDSRKVSELKLCHELLDELPKRSLMIADDLYNCFEIIAKCHHKGIELLFPSKRKRNYEVVEKLGEGDEIIKIKTPKNRSKWLDDKADPGTFYLRRVECTSPEGKKYTLNTTITDKNISKEKIQMLYLTRWDIEISIREIKMVMDVHIIRSQTPEMALKELTVALATYNLVRKIINASLKNLPFPPKEDFIYQYYTSSKELRVDKKGRVYSRWSSGRKGNKLVD